MFRKRAGAAAPQESPPDTSKKKPRPVTVDAPEAYRMATGTRLLLWLPAVLLGLGCLLGLYLLCTPQHEPWPYRFLGFLEAAICGLFVWLSRVRLGGVVVRALTENGEIHFRRFDGREVVAPSRGRTIRKESMGADSVLVLLRPVESEDRKDRVALLRQDKEAMAYLSGLERKGIVRGPGNIKDRFPNPLVPR